MCEVKGLIESPFIIIFYKEIPAHKELHYGRQKPERGFPYVFLKRSKTRKYFYERAKPV